MAKIIIEVEFDTDRAEYVLKNSSGDIFTFEYSTMNKGLYDFIGTAHRASVETTNSGLNIPCVVKSLPLREFKEAVDEYVNDQENHEIKRTPQRMTTIKAVAHWCKRFAEHLAK